ncbi:MAG TPA: hypothetical protein VMU16_05875 [Candidatus Binataceae bacterium]|nr:hypothetical protein [Candidatus Binataceae bacterium]
MAEAVDIREPGVAGLPKGSSILYSIKRDSDDRVILTPSPVFAGGMAGMFGSGAAFMIYLATIFLRTRNTNAADFWIAGLFLCVAAYSAWLGLSAWRSRGIPLVIERGGRVLYGADELCAPGTIESVRIAPARGGEAGDCEVCFEIAGGKIVWMPSQYFGAGGSSAQIRPFAAFLADAIGVPVTEKI